MSKKVHCILKILQAKDTRNPPNLLGILTHTCRLWFFISITRVTGNHTHCCWHCLASRELDLASLGSLEEIRLDLKFRA